MSIEKIIKTEENLGPEGGYDKSKKENLWEKIKRYANSEKLKYNIIDSTAMCIEANPVFAAFETGIAGMTDGASLNARIIGSLSLYAGMGSVYGKGRDSWRKLFKVTDKTKERIQCIHDMVYAATFNIAVTPVIYLISGVRNIEEIIIGTACATVFGAVNGGPMGYSIDAFRDLSGIKPCERKSYPDTVRKQPSKIKKVIIAGAIAAMIGVTSMVYQFVPNKNVMQYITKPKPTIEQKIEKTDYITIP